MLRAPVNPRVVQGGEHLLVAIFTVTLLVVIAGAYISLIQPDERAQTAAPVATTTTTTVAPQPAPPAPAVVVSGSSPTTTEAPANPSCQVPAPAAAPGTMSVRVSYPCPGAVPAGMTRWVTRRVPTSDRVLTATLGEMLAGPTAEEQEAGFRSYWSEATAGSLRSVRLASGVASIDLGPLPVGTPDDVEAGQAWLASTASTIFQFDTVKAIELTMDGSCDAFWQSIGTTDCVRLDRFDWGRQLAAWREATLGPPEHRG